MTASQIRPRCLRVSSPDKHHCLLGQWLAASCPHTTGPGMRAGKVAARLPAQGDHSVTPGTLPVLGLGLGLPPHPDAMKAERTL